MLKVTQIRLHFLLLVLVPAVLDAQELPFTHYTAEREINPLPSSAVMMTHQDRLGYIWFVVYSSGLIRYDGRRLDRYDGADGLPSVDVRELVEDKDGHLWVSTEAGLGVSTKPLDAYEVGERVVFTDSLDGTSLPGDSMIENRVCVSRDGMVWVGSRNLGILRFRITSSGGVMSDTLATETASSKGNLEVRALTVRSDGTVWASLSGGLLAAYRENGTLIGVTRPGGGLPGIDCDALAESAVGILYAGYGDGTIRALSGSATNPSVREVQSPLTSRITDINLLEDRGLWVSSEQSGVLRIGEQGSMSWYTVRNGLKSDLVRHVMNDREGNIWISQIGGSSKLRSDYHAYLSYTGASHGGLAPYLKSDGVNNVIPPGRNPGQNGTWVATSGGGVSLLGTSGPLMTVGMEHGLKSDWVHGLAFDENGRLWIGTSSGISCLSMNGVPPPPPSQRRATVRTKLGTGVLAGYGFGNSTIYACEVIRLPGPGGTSVESIWFTGYRQVFCVIGSRWFILGEEAGLPDTYCTSIAADSGGTLWLGTRDGGLYRSNTAISSGMLSGARTKVFQKGPGGSSFGRLVTENLFTLAWDEESGAPSNQIESMVIKDDLIWIGSPVGLTAFDPMTGTQSHHLGMENGIPGADVTSLALDRSSGHLWLGTNGGLALVDPVSRTVIRTVTKANGLLDNEVWWYGSVRVDTDGKVFFGTAKGLAVFDPKQAKRNPVPPLVRFREVQFRESPASNTLSIRYAGLSFADETQVRFRTIVDGYEDEWSEETDEVSMRYTNLPAFFVPRTYTVRVNARNNHGVWSESPISIAFDVQPAWWFQWWFALINAVILAALSYGFMHYRTIHLRRRSEQLERTVEERTVEIREKAEQISQQKDELAGKNVELEMKNAEIIRTQEQLIVHEKLASLGALTAGIAHEIKNPLNFVNNFSDVSVEIAQELKDDLESLRDKIDPEIFKRIEYSCLDLQENAQKINEHGKRADGIVKGMLEHSRGQTGVREETDINALVGEYITLAYHGFKGQEPECTVTFERSFDPSVGTLDVFPQDLSRVILNIVNNACFAVYEKQRKEGETYAPKVTVSTAREADHVAITIRDNGTGMPPDVREKIFNPFYTTKPTGKGTGLGMSLSHDIVVKQHGGRIEVESEEGNYTEFRVVLPVVNQGG